MCELCKSYVLLSKNLGIIRPHLCDWSNSVSILNDEKMKNNGEIQTDVQNAIKGELLLNAAEI